MNDPLDQLMAAVIQFCSYKDMYRTDAERTARILKACRQALYRTEFELTPEAYQAVQCVYDAGEQAQAAE